jgi:hypothetical protein
VSGYRARGLEKLTDLLDMMSGLPPDLFSKLVSGRGQGSIMNDRLGYDFKLGNTQAIYGNSNESLYIEVKASTNDRFVVTQNEISQSEARSQESCKYVVSLIPFFIDNRLVIRLVDLVREFWSLPDSNSDLRRLEYISKCSDLLDIRWYSIEELVLEPHSFYATPHDRAATPPAATTVELELWK